MNNVMNIPEDIEFERVNKNYTEMNHIVRRIKDKLDWVVNERRKQTINSDGSVCEDGRSDDSGENSEDPEAI